MQKHHALALALSMTGACAANAQTPTAVADVKKEKPASKKRKVAFSPFLVFFFFADLVSVA